MPTDLAADLAAILTDRAPAELAELRAHRADRPNVLAARVLAAVAAGNLSAAALAERQRRAVVALVPDDDGEQADRLDAEHGTGHEPTELPHACPLCAEDCGDPFGLFERRTVADTISAIADLAPVDCGACTYRAFDAADLVDHAAANHADDEPAAGGAHGRCDTCGAPCGPAGCRRDPGHVAALDVD